MLYSTTRMYYVPALLSEYQAGPPTLLIIISGHLVFAVSITNFSEIKVNDLHIVS